MGGLGGSALLRWAQGSLPSLRARKALIPVGVLRGSPWPWRPVAKEKTSRRQGRQISLDAMTQSPEGSWWQKDGKEKLIFRETTTNRVLHGTVQ